MGTTEPAARGSRFGDAVERLNITLRRYIGAPPLGPFDEPPLPPRQAAACPLCGRPMAEHDIDRSAPRTQLTCPQ